MNKLPVLTITIPLLLEWKGLNDTSLAEAINRKAKRDIVSQTAIWRMTSGESKQPRDSTIEPVANYFGISIAQIKDINYVRALVVGAPAGVDEIKDKLTAVYDGLALKDKEALLQQAILLDLARRNS
tara:strand:+ start:1019 stop:1399 length:381 start_codon:yes stop_codon:yes gene_type:complete